MYNVGDKVIIRSWHEVAKARGQEKGKIYCEAHCVYDFSMNDYAGKTAVIDSVAEVHEHEGAVEFFYRLVSESGELLPHRWTDSMLVPREAAAKQTDGAAEEKFAGRPQIQIGDVVRVVGEGDNTESCHVVSAVRDTGVYSEYPHYHYNEEIVAVYRFDGLNFTCIWESGEGWLNRFKNSLLGLRKSTKEFNDNMEKLIAAIKKSKEKVGDGKHGSEEAD